jgi:hypothetical protein
LFVLGGEEDGGIERAVVLFTGCGCELFKFGDDAEATDLDVVPRVGIGGGGLLGGEDDTRETEGEEERVGANEGGRVEDGEDVDGAGEGGGFGGVGSVAALAFWCAALEVREEEELVEWLYKAVKAATPAETPKLLLFCRWTVVGACRCFCQVCNSDTAI